MCSHCRFHAHSLKYTNLATVSAVRNVEAPNICLHFFVSAVVAMLKRLTFVCIFSLVLGTIVDGNAASTLKMTCSGNLTNTRADGVTLDQCDLNFLSVKAMTEIENVCGIPGTVDTPAENQCRIRAVVAPDPSSAADHRKLYRVLELWSVDKR
jgi:hypothetical protein